MQLSNPDAHAPYPRRPAAEAAAERLLHHHPHVTIAYLKQTLPPSGVTPREPYYELPHETGIPLH